MKISRKFSTPDNDPLDAVAYDRRSTVITEPDGTEVFRLEDFEVPEGWSQLAADIVASKYFRKRGVPKTGGETSVRQVVYRIAHTIRNAGETLGGDFDTEVDAAAFEKELSHLLVNQMGAFNSPVWFNCGLKHYHGIEGKAVRDRESLGFDVKFALWGYPEEFPKRRVVMFAQSADPEVSKGVDATIVLPEFRAARIGVGPEGLDTRVRIEVMQTVIASQKQRRVVVKRDGTQPSRLDRMAPAVA